MKECLIRNLCDGPRDYPLADGSSVYLGSKSRSTGIARIQKQNISAALKLAESKGLVMIEKIHGEESSDDEFSYDEAGEYLVRNLCDIPCDYSLTDGSSIYLGSRGSATEAAQVSTDKISDALKLAISKGLVSIEELHDEEAGS